MYKVVKGHVLQVVSIDDSIKRHYPNCEGKFVTYYRFSGMTDEAIKIIDDIEFSDDLSNAMLVSEGSFILKRNHFRKMGSTYKQYL